MTDESIDGGLKVKKSQPKFTLQKQINDYLKEHVPISAVVEKMVDFRVANVVGMKCPKCGSDQIFAHSEQRRAADEAMTVFYECLKCGLRTKKG